MNIQLRACLTDNTFIILPEWPNTKCVLNSTTETKSWMRILNKSGKYEFTSWWHLLSNALLVNPSLDGEGGVGMSYSNIGARKHKNIKNHLFSFMKVLTIFIGSKAAVGMTDRVNRERIAN